MNEEKQYTFEVGGTKNVILYTKAEFAEVLRSNRSKLERVFAADPEAWEMRKEVEGR